MNTTFDEEIAENVLSTTEELDVDEDETLLYKQERGKPMPREAHVEAQFYCTIALARYAQKYTILPEIDIQLGRKKYVPDLAVFPKRPINRQRSASIKEAPILAIEILSPKQALDDLFTKAYTYFEHGTSVWWIVQPSIESVLVMQPHAKPRFITDGDIFDDSTDIRVNIAEIFP